jgi:hypothetical protein
MSDLLLTATDTWDLEPVLEVWVHAQARPVVVTLAGRLDKSTESGVRDLLKRLVDEGHRDVIVDLSGVQSVDRGSPALPFGALEQGPFADRNVIVLAGGDKAPGRGAFGIPAHEGLRSWRRGD